MEDKADSGSVQKAVPVLCAQGCGFYGSSTTLNMCSKCFRETQKLNNQVTEAPLPSAGGAAKELESSVAAATAAGADRGSPGPLSGTASGNVCSAPLMPRLESVVRSSLSTPVKPLSELEPSGPRTPMVNLSASLSSQAADASSAAASLSEDVAPSEAAVEAPVALPAALAPGSPKRKIQKNPGRCWECRKKVGLLGFKCRCDYTYCSEHRYTDKHACDFDYKQLGKQNLEKANPQVVASKLEKI